MSFRLTGWSSTTSRHSPAMSVALAYCVRAGQDARQDRAEHRALPRLAAHFHAPPLRLGQASGQGEAEAAALVALGYAGIELLEYDEQPIDVFAREADAVILDFKAEIPLALGCAAHLHAAVL